MHFRVRLKLATKRRNIKKNQNAKKKLQKVKFISFNKNVPQASIIVIIINDLCST